MNEVVCRWDGRECFSDHPCITFIRDGKACIVCLRFKGDIEAEEKKYLNNLDV